MVEGVGGGHGAEVVGAMHRALRDLGEVDVVDERHAVQRRGDELVVLRVRRPPRPPSSCSRRPRWRASPASPSAAPPSPRRSASPR